MTDDARGLTERAVAWTYTGDAEIPYTTEVDGRRFTVRINDLPAEPLYTLLSEGAELYDLAREERHHVEVSGLSRRLPLLLPFRAEVLEALAPSTALPPLILDRS